MALLLVRVARLTLEETLSMTWDEAEAWLESALELERELTPRS